MASERDVQEWAQELPDKFLECRDFGHSWRAHAVRFDGEYNSYERTLRCARCRSERHEALSLSGSKSSRGYRYPDGYTAPRGTGHLVLADRDALRIEAVTRQVNDPTLLKRGAQMEAARQRGKTRG